MDFKRKVQLHNVRYMQTKYECSSGDSQFKQVSLPNDKRRPMAEKQGQIDEAYPKTTKWTIQFSYVMESDHKAVYVNTVESEVKENLKSTGVCRRRCMPN